MPSSPPVTRESARPRVARSGLFLARRGDKLLACERNAIIFYANEALLAAAKTLGWKHGKGVDYVAFVEHEIARIHEKVACLAAPNQEVQHERQAA